tara:strand:+ start:7798 stop:8439 length:642 start_codon:yes stop_codon:yes gene_type:complete
MVKEKLNYLKSIIFYDDFNKIVSVVGLLSFAGLMFILLFYLPLSFCLSIFFILLGLLYLFLLKNTVKQILIQRPNNSGNYEFYLEYWDREVVNNLNSKYLYETGKSFSSSFIPILREQDEEIIYIEWENLDRSNYYSETLDSLTGAEELDTIFDEARGLSKREIINYSFYMGIIIVGALLIVVLFGEYSDVLYPKNLIPDNIIIEDIILEKDL